MHNEEIKRLRQMVGLSQYELAALANVGRNKLSLAECGYVQFTANEQARIEQALKSAVATSQEQFQSLLSRGTALIAVAR